MSGILIVAHREREEARNLTRLAAGWLHDHGHRAWMLPSDAHPLGLDDLADERPPASADLALSIGGDGTILRTVHVLDGAAVWVLGVNIGLLGYLTEVEPDQLTPALERVLRGEGHIEERMMVSVAVVRRDGTALGPWRALNEASLEKREAGHTVRLLVRIDGEVFTSYQADGLIVATPTGSTAYSLSARGPVISPRHQALLMTPVSPHQLFDRSLVLAPDETVDVEVLEHRPVDLAVDGQQVVTLERGDRVQCGVADVPALFVRLGPLRFHQILKAKFGLTDR